MGDLEHGYYGYDQEAEIEKTLSEYDDTIEPKPTIIPAKKARAKDYDKVCHELGFNPGVKFIKITTRGTIGFTCGKPEEFRPGRVKWTYEKEG
ncbi:hypothetical protein SELR_pSRC300660 (plasmid) [Selenomonas ruminantium subsp. lactilytica TAM6421]|uniref:Uncharacterized protein n=1 Tax=Selenomonas ruminantium subsp. lactilytica (strain NBRC 103574 / TAM6421) TaxID=927704 RepID=I0GWK2_SELRL|nr:hypothetical protein [Selenomonas ruminantium]BAL85139.1 hypothetical protein SELR_pSRC300660 [Selenomonas ruminantium subsp. lactilytica TAM6421]